jgi:MFS transporter, DHA2 family, multidrug resistance protein
MCGTSKRSANPLRISSARAPRSLRAASLGGAANSIAFTAIVYVGTLYLQLALDYSPLQAGLALLPLDAVAFVVPLAGAGMIARHAPRPLRSHRSRSPPEHSSGWPAHPSPPATSTTSLDR